MNRKPDKLTSSVDWVTATTRSNKIGQSWFRTADAFGKQATENRRAENNGQSAKFVTRRKIRQYDGIQYDGMFWGRSEHEGYMMILQGGIANRYWPDVLPVARKVSRLDLCVTAYFEDPILNVAQQHYASLGDANNKQRKFSIIQNSEGGQTLYLGSRNSDYFGRVYDKGAQKGGEPGYAWRYEIEIKAKKTTGLGKRLFAAWVNDLPVYENIATTVYDWFKVRGITPKWRVSGQRIHIETQVDITTVDRKLRWLNTQVSPTIEELISLGYRADVERAIGHQLTFFSDPDLDAKTI